MEINNYSSIETRNMEETFPYARDRLLKMWRLSVDNPTRSVDGKIMSLKIQVQFVDEDVELVLKRIAKRKRNNPSGYSKGQIQAEKKQMENISWFSAHRLKIKAQLQLHRDMRNRERMLEVEASAGPTPSQAGPMPPT